MDMLDKHSAAIGRFAWVMAWFGLVAFVPCRGTMSVTALDGRGARATLSRVCRPPSTTDPSTA